MLSDCSVADKQTSSGQAFRACPEDVCLSGLGSSVSLDWSDFTCRKVYAEKNWYVSVDIGIKNPSGT